MEKQELAMYVLMIANGIISFIGFQNHEFFERFKLNVGKIERGGQYYRGLTSSFLHVDITHLIFNMLGLFFFAPTVISITTWWYFLIIYFLSVLSGSLFSVLSNRTNYLYSAVGASAGVTGILYAAISAFPESKMAFVFIPMVEFPAWAFAIGYLLYSIFGMKTKMGSIGHEAHIGGALMGMILMIGYEPSILEENWKYILLISLPLIYFLYEIYKKNKK